MGYAAIPILTLLRKTQSPFLIGSGTLLRTKAGVFLITAKHVIDELKDGVIITSGKNKFIRFKPQMAAFQYIEGNTLDHDVCVAYVPSRLIGIFILGKDLKVVHQLEASGEPRLPLARFDRYFFYAGFHVGMRNWSICENTPHWCRRSLTAPLRAVRPPCPTPGFLEGKAISGSALQ